MSPIEALHSDPSGSPRDSQQFDLDPTKITRQRMLSASEVIKLLDADYERLKQEFGELNSGAAYGRIGWKLRLELALSNPLNPRPYIDIKSRRIAHNVIATAPDLAAVEDYPLKDAAGVAAVELERQITSPNLERMRNGIPIPTAVSQRDGTTTITPVTYPKPAPGEPGFGDGDMTIRDESRTVSAELGAGWDLSAEDAALLDAENAAATSDANANANAAAEAAQAAASAGPIEEVDRTERTNELLDPPVS